MENIMGIKQDIPPDMRLKYEKGDLIIKEGDYGTSVYKIIKGEVGIFDESGDREIGLATLGPGEVFGEMSFMSGGTETRTASAIALQDTELEVWHPSRLSKEYEEMPPIIKYIANQALERLARTNKLLVELHTKESKERGEEKKRGRLRGIEPWESQRVFYRKEVDLECTYRPLGASPKVRLAGRFKDISLSGAGMEVLTKNTVDFSHEPDDTFHVSTVLPNGKELDLTGKVLTVRKSRIPGRLFLGISFIEMTEGARKRLGFFLMP
jgi:CRP-like cAMP-binding protein